MKITTPEQYRQAKYGYVLLDDLLSEIEVAATLKKACLIIKAWRDSLTHDMAEADKDREQDRR